MKWINILILTKFKLSPMLMILIYLWSYLLNFAITYDDFLLNINSYSADSLTELDSFS